MKSFLSLFFTAPAKVFFSLILFFTAMLIGDCQTGYFNLYAEDSESFINAITQFDSYDFETSHYFKNTVRTTIEDVMKLSMEYEEVFEEISSPEELLSHYSSIGDNTFIKIYENLSSMKGFRFAVVNHDKCTIYSNIDEINGKSSGIRVRKHFGQAGKNLLIVRSCHNPYFETDSFIDFAEHIRNSAEKYDDNFDIYISFGSEESFKTAAEKYEKLHFAMREKIEKLNNTVPVYLAILVLIMFILLTVTGKHEPRGKTYPTIMNKLPNDLLVIMYTIVLICLSSLYRTAFTMIVSHGNELEEFWFTHSREFYTSRIKFCIVTFICIFTNFICLLKRQWKMGLLFKNTYIYTYITNIKKVKKGEDVNEIKPQ